MSVGVAARGVSHRLRSRATTVEVLHGIDFDLAPSGYLALTGPSGAGKSTLLSVIGGLEPLQAGEVTVGGLDLRTLSGRELAAYRQETVGFVFQDYGLLDVLDAAGNVEMSMALAGVPRRRRRRAAVDLLDRVGLAHRRRHRPVELSGGERQRVAIARALALRPRLVLADEPTGNLDEEAAGLVLDLLEGHRRATGATLIVVTHSRAVAARAVEQRTLKGGRWVA